MHFYVSMRTAPWCPDLSERGMVIDELPLVTMPHPGEVRQMVDDYLRRQAITFTNLIELRSTQTIINLIRNDMGVALLPDFSVDDLAERGLLRRVLADHLTLTAYYGVHKNKWRSPVMELFLEILAEECGALGSACPRLGLRSGASGTANHPGAGAPSPPRPPGHWTCQQVLLGLSRCFFFWKDVHLGTWSTRRRCHLCANTPIRYLGSEAPL